MGESVHCNLSEILEWKELKPADLADLIGASRQTIHSIINDKFKCNIETALKLSDVLNLSVHDLFTLNDDSSFFIDLFHLEIIEKETMNQQIEQTGYEFFDLVDRVCLTRKRLMTIRSEYFDKNYSNIYHKVQEEHTDFDTKKIKAETRFTINRQLDRRYIGIYHKLGFSL